MRYKPTSSQTHLTCKILKTNNYTCVGKKQTINFNMIPTSNVDSDNFEVLRRDKMSKDL